MEINFIFSKFVFCSGLTSVTIGNSVTKIGNSAFTCCSGITSVTCNWSEPITCSENIFDSEVYSKPLYIPKGTTDKYYNTVPWYRFTNVIETESGASKATYNVSISMNAANGYVVVNGTKIQSNSYSLSVSEGEKLSLQFVPNDGYYLRAVIVSGEDITSKAQNGSYEISSVDKNISVAVEFAEKPIYLSIKNADNGYVKQVIEKGKQYTFVITPNNGWQIESVSFNGVDVTSELDGNTYVTPAITSDSELLTVYKSTNQGSVKNVISSNIRVLATHDGISITSDGQSTTAFVYNVSGQLQKSCDIDFGTTNIYLQSNGVYIVKIGNQTYKVAL